MRDLRDAGNERFGGARGARGMRGAWSLVFRVSLVALVASLLAFVAAESASAQSLLNRSNRNLRGNNNRNAATNRLRAPAQTEAAPAADENADPSAINWDATPVDIVLQAYGERVGKTVLKDPACPSATITLKSRPGQKLSDEEYIDAIETILEMNGVHLEPYGESFVRALPRKDVRKEGIPLIMDQDAKIGESTRVVSVMIRFNNISTEEAQKVLEGLKSNNGVLLVFERTNSILATDTEQNINRMLEIAKAVDVATPVLENVYVRQITNASAQEILEAIQKIVEESQKEQEKNGKTPNNNAQRNRDQDRPASRLLGGLRRPGQNNNNQPASAINNESIVMSVSDADRGMIRGKVVIVPDERSNKLIFVTSKSNMDFFDKVIESLDVETTPDTVVKVYRLKYALAEDVSDMINDLIGNAPSSKNSSKSNQNQNARQGSSGNLTRSTPNAPAAPRRSVNQRTGDAKAGELSKENTTVLSDKRINGLVVMTQKELVPTLEAIIESMDIKLSQVLIETVIIEVGLGDGIETGMDWVQKGRQKYQTQVQNAKNQDMFYRTRTTTVTDSDGNSRTTTSVLDDLVPAGYSYSHNYTTGSGSDQVRYQITDTASEVAGTMAAVARDGAMNYYGGGLATALGGGSGGGSQAHDIAAGFTSNVFGKAFTFVFDSDRLGLSAILQASKTDSHSKYIASPVVMTVDNKEATVDATENRQFITGWTAQSGSYGNSGQPTPNYTAKDIGIKLKMTPKINPNGTVMLTVEEEYSQVNIGGQSMLVPMNGVYVSQNVDIAVERKMTADVLLEDGQTVVFGGLVETVNAEAETGIPFLKDIPFIGKWLFGTVSRQETRKELLVFLTPYVLDDAQAAQAEALRRKKTLSDSRPWDDHGWSASKLADPVSRREQLRRLKDEWKKQDEERKTKIAIETEKVNRAKMLKNLSKEERDLWIKMHKEELDEEKQKELEEKLLDDESQEELKKLAEQVRAKKLAAAEKEIKANEDLTHAENERAKLDAEKRKREEGKSAEEPAAETKPEPVAEVKPEPAEEVKPEK